MIILFVFILGLVIGSFLNVVIYRLHQGIGFIGGRSACPQCKHVLNTADLVPLLSFLLLRGKCHYCGRSISWQYPLVELATGISFLLIFLRFGLTASTAVYFGYACFLLVIFVYDLRYYLILDRITVPGIIIAFIFSFFVLKMTILNIMLGTLIGGGFFLLQYLISRGKWIGGGDLRLGALMGMMLGYPQILVALFIAYLFGSVVGLFLIISGRKKWQSQVPFGTFLAVSTFITFFLGQGIVDYYKTLWLL